MNDLPRPHPAVSYLFRVDIDGVSLGSFTKISGLSAKYETEKVIEGGENTFEHQLIGRVTYTNIKLTRPVDESSGVLAEWFSARQLAIQQKSRGTRSTGQITAYGANHLPITQWSLKGVVPVSYEGPSFTTGASSILTETVEINHQGFWRGDSESIPAPALVAMSNAPGGSSAASVASRTQTEIRGMF